MAPPDFSDPLLHSSESVGNTERRTSGNWRTAFLRHDAAPSSRTKRPLRLSALEGRNDEAPAAVTGSSAAPELKANTAPQAEIVDQDLQLIEQLTQKIEQRPAGRVQKPKPPPKPSPHRSLDGSIKEPSAALVTAKTPSTATTKRTRQQSGTHDSVVSNVPTHIMEAAPTVNPVVPSSGHLFSGYDIDNILDRMHHDGERFGVQSFVGSTSGRVLNSNAPAVRPQMVNSTNPAAAREPVDPTAHAHVLRRVPSREGLKAQMRAIDSWLAEDVSAREKMHGKCTDDLNVSLEGLLHKANSNQFQGPTIEMVLSVLKDIKAQKLQGEPASEIKLRELAADAKELIAGLSVEKLVDALKLFASARCEDYDLYLRILGEVTLQMSSATPELIVTLSSILRRLRLSEDTYLELLSKQAMNMIRVHHKAAPRTPRRGGLSRAEERSRNPMLAPTLSSLSIWEAHSHSETLFNPEQLIRMGNAFSILDVKHDSRFVDIFQDQLSWACPLLTASQCEMVHPTLALGPLVNDGTRRLFLEQCAKVGAGRPIPHSGSDKKAREVIPDVKSFQAESSRRRSRLKHISNIYIIEAFVRKEHLEFFSSLPANVKAYLDALHEDACHLAVKPPSNLTSQVAGALRKLGVKCELGKKVGPICLHITAQGKHSSEVKDVSYECNDLEDFYAPKVSERGTDTPELTSMARLRHRLLEMLGVRPVHINIWEWRTLSESQQINYMVKLQALQESS